jgi:hypothetical protein
MQMIVAQGMLIAFASKLDRELIRVIRQHVHALLTSTGGIQRRVAQH